MFRLYIFQYKSDEHSVRKDKSINIRLILLGPKADEAPDFTSWSLTAVSRLL